MYTVKNIEENVIKKTIWQKKYDEKCCKNLKITTNI